MAKIINVKCTLSIFLKIGMVKKLVLASFKPDQSGVWFLVQPVEPVGSIQFLKLCN